MTKPIKRCASVIIAFALAAAAVGCGAGFRAPPGEGSATNAAGVGSATESIGEGGGMTMVTGQDAQESPANTGAPPNSLDTEESDGDLHDSPPDSETSEEEASRNLIPDNDTDESGDDVADSSLPDFEAQEDDPGRLGAARPVFGLIDAHADTITRALLRDQGMYRNNLHVDFERLLRYGAPVQVFALWCADRYVDDAFEYTNSLIDFFESEVAAHSDIIEIALTPEDMERNARTGKISAVLAIEGGEALMGRIENLEHFYERGVRIMALTWNRENELGYGQATESEEGLKPFGEQCVRRMEELGMIMDVSHLNEAGFWDAHWLSTRPYIASHSNAAALTPHRRNLVDTQIVAIVESGGIVGMAMYPLFLSPNDGADIGDILANIGHFIDLGAGGNLGLGSDFDGFNTMPAGISDVSSFALLGERISEAFGEEVSTAIMWGNFYDFFLRYFSG